jgi:hypothetical protein
VEASKSEANWNDSTYEEDKAWRSYWELLFYMLTIFFLILLFMDLIKLDL